MRSATHLLLLTTLMSGAPLATMAAADHPGRKIYLDKCANCHGQNGEGVRNEYADPLVGDRSLSSLIRYIEKQMPEDKPGTCVGEEAKQVSAYIYDAFYSPEAQLRTNPPRVELTRLTVGQYRTTIADLIGSFTNPAKPDSARGLKAEYFNDKRGFNGQKRLIDRIEPTVQVRFADGAKPGDQFDNEEYAIRWSGALIAPETGDYDIIVETTNGMRLWVNDNDWRKPLIDGWVRSGDDPRQVTTVRLLAGRHYFLKLEIAKEKKEKVVAATLKWKPPHQAETIIPEHYLSPGGGATWLVLNTPFPPDDNSLGYERGSSVSKAWDEATTQAAFEVATYVTERLQRFSGAKPEDADARSKHIAFCRRFAERAFRRPLDDEQAKFFVDQHFADGVSSEDAAKKALLLILKSPRFLYLGVGGTGSDDHTIAAKVSYALWDSLPDQRLLDLAKKGGLQKRDVLAKEVERMIADPRTATKLRTYVRRWLKVDDLHGLHKTDGKFPGFDDHFIVDLRTSLEMTIDEVLNDPNTDYRRFFTDKGVWMNGRMAKFYGLDKPADAPFEKVTFEDQPRAGVLTHPLLMAGFAYSDITSPIHRGVFVSRNLLGRRLRSPPDSITPESPHLSPKLTTRERVTKQTRPVSCQSCHDMINPLGFAMEHFDTVGRYRTEEGGKRIDASGAYLRADAELAKFTDARDLGAFVAEGSEAHAAFVERLFKDAIKQPIMAYGANEKERLRQFFNDNACNIRKLLGEIVVSATLADAVRAGKTPSDVKAAAK
jgi:cytochrome c553